MSKQTEKLHLFKYDPETDGSLTFNVEQALNENWDKLDAAIAEKAALGEDGKVPQSQIPDLLASKVRTDAGETVEAALVGKAPVVHKHTASDVGAAAVKHAAAHKTGGTDPLVPADIGAEAAFPKKTAFNKDFGSAAGTVCQGNDARLSDARTPKSHTHAVADITGTMAVAKGGTGQTTLTPAVTTKALRSSYAGTADLAAGSSALTTGMCYLQYE